MKIKLIISLIILFCAPTLFAHAGKVEPIPVVVSIPPQKYFVQQIAGDLATITVMVPKGFEPEDYEPRPQQLKALTHACLYFAIDVPFETTWLKKIQDINPHTKIVPTYQGIKKIEMSPDEHGHSHAFSSSMMKDPHIWLSPKLVLTQAKNIRDAFIEIDPAHTKTYQSGYEKLAHQIEQLHRFILSLGDKIKNKKGKFFFILHPSLGYFAKEYGLTQIAIEKDGKSPTLKQLDEIVQLSKKHHIKTVFMTPEYAPKTAEVVAKAIHGKTELIDPLSEDWLENLKSIALTIFKSLQTKE